MEKQIIYTGNRTAKPQVMTVKGETAKTYLVDNKAFNPLPKNRIEKCNAANFRNGSSYFLYSEYLELKKNLLSAMAAKGQK